MKQMNNARFVEWPLMFLAMNLLFSFNSLTSSAQSNTKPPNMINTVWWSPMKYHATPAGLVTEQSFFLFEQDSKVTQQSTAMQLSQIEAVPSGQSLMYNPIPWVYQEGANPLAYNSPYRYTLTVSPGLTASVKEVGRYRLVDRTLYIDFPSSRVVATFDGKKMIGQSTDNKTNEKKEWSVQRVPEDLLRPAPPANDEKMRLRPRTLSTLSVEQREGLMQGLRLAPEHRQPVEVVCASGDEEAYSFASELVAVLQAAGWQATDVRQVAFNGTPVGLLIQLHNSKNGVTVATSLLTAAFRNGGLVFREVEDSEHVSPHTIRLIVGRRP